MTPGEAAAWADFIMLVTPDEGQGALSTATTWPAT